MWTRIKYTDRDNHEADVEDRALQVDVTHFHFYLRFVFSVLIPVYQFDASQLIEEVCQSAVHAGVLCEIHVCDDHSPDHADLDRMKDRCGEMKNVFFHQNQKNIGRSATRNRLVSFARFDHILFIDSDSALADPLRFIQNYRDATTRADVIVGGTIYEKNKPPSTQHLHWLYGRHRESKMASQRNRNPVRYFFSNNFFSKKEILIRYPFDESLTGYGYEDSQWAQQIASRHSILHIDNAVIHLGLKSAERFLDDADSAILVLAGKEAFRQLPRVHLLREYRHLQASFAGRLILSICRSGEGWLRRGLLSGRLRSLILFDLYRLGRLHAQLTKKSR